MQQSLTLILPPQKSSLVMSLTLTTATAHTTHPHTHIHVTIPLLLAGAHARLVVHHLLIMPALIQTMILPPLVPIRPEETADGRLFCHHDPLLVRVSDAHLLLQVLARLLHVMSAMTTVLRLIVRVLLIIVPPLAPHANATPIQLTMTVTNATDTPLNATLVEIMIVVAIRNTMMMTIAVSIRAVAIVTGVSMKRRAVEKKKRKNKTGKIVK